MHTSNVGRVLGTLAVCGALAVASAATARAQEERALSISAADGELDWSPCPELFPRGCEIAVLRGDPAQRNADIFLRVPGGYEFPAHSHTSAERMILVSGRMELHFKGQPAQTLARGDYAYGPAGLPHVARCVSKDRCTLFIAFEEPVDALPYAGTIR